MVRFEHTPGGSLKKTVAIIATNIVEGSRHPMVLDVALHIVGREPDQLTVSPATRDLAEITAIHRWVVQNIRYTKDVLTEETVRDAEAVLRQRQGDCDDHAVITGALLQAVGHPVQIWLSGETVPSHIYLCAKYGDTWYPVDTTLKHRPVGCIAHNKPNHHHWRVENVLPLGE